MIALHFPNIGIKTSGKQCYRAKVHGKLGNENSAQTSFPTHGLFGWLNTILQSFVVDESYIV